MDSKEKIARKNILKKGKETTGVAIKGYDFNQGIDYNKIIDSYSSTGYQATAFSNSIDIINEMISKKSKIFLGYTSNMVSSGLRDIFRYLLEHKKVDVVVTSGGGVEEDIIKCLGDFTLGDFKADGKKLRDDAINRIGNIFVPNSRYVEFEKFVQSILEDSMKEQKKGGKAALPSDIIWKLGEKINDKRSICYWAYKNKVKIYCPSMMDGSLGDMIYFFKYKNPDFQLDIAEDTKQLNESTVGLDKSGVIILGSGLVKHSILNAHLYRDGADYAIFINTASEFDGSDAGASPDEAVSWGKIRKDGKSVKVFGDATILFPLIVAKTFAKKV